MMVYLLLCFRVSPPIRQAPAADALEQRFRAHRVIKPELLTMVVTEVKFSGVAVQVMRAAMLIYAIHAAFGSYAHRRARILPRYD
jgi:hypothetical protein